LNRESTDQQEGMNMENQSKTSPVALIVFWLYVLIPLGWGVLNTLRAAGKLFSG
jgi:F0F1-type ATP synthase assembly protein I